MRVVLGMILGVALMAAYQKGALDGVLGQAKDAAAKQVQSLLAGAQKTARAQSEPESGTGTPSGNPYYQPAPQQPALLPPSYYNKDTTASVLRNVYYSANPFFWADTDEQAAIRTQAARLAYQLDSGEADVGTVAAQAQQLQQEARSLGIYRGR